MQNSIVITDSGRFEEIINSMENSYKVIQNIIEKEHKNVEMIDQTEVWTGECARSMYNKYKQLNGNYSLIDYSLNLYIKFLRKTLEDYRRVDEEVSRNIDNMESNFDVNS